jgi:hypothetical protein
VSQPTESVGTKNVIDRDDTATGLDGMFGVTNRLRSVGNTVHFLKMREFWFVTSLWL